MASAIEAAMTADERAKFLQQIRAGVSFRIKLISAHEPCLFDFVASPPTVDFSFDLILKRFNLDRLEQAPLLSGTSRVPSLELFTLPRQQPLDLLSPKPGTFFVY